MTLRFKSCLTLAASLSGLCASAFGSAGVAWAQSVVPGQSVADRPHPDYDPVGHHVGGFTLFPALQTSIDATDNYRATNTNKEGDVYLTLQPNVRLRSNWTRHRLDLTGYVSRSFHFSQSTENISQYGTTATGVYDISRRTAVRVDVAATRGAESRASLGSFRGAAEPVRFDNFRAGVALTQDFDPLAVDLLFSVERVNYHDAEIAGGGVADQDFRDVDIVTTGGGVRYDLQNGVSLVASARYQQNSYDFGPDSAGFNPLLDIDRRSSGFTLLGGVSLELTKLLTGYVQVGYLGRDYRDARLRDLNGLSFDANLLWNVTPLTSIRLRGSRSIDETSSQLSAGNTRTDVSLRVDHELYRNLILNADTSFTHFSPNGVGFGGDEYGVGVGARYLMNRRYSFTANLRYTHRSSESAFLRYGAFAAGIGLRVAF